MDNEELISILTKAHEDEFIDAVMDELLDQENATEDERIKIKNIIVNDTKNPWDVVTLIRIMRIMSTMDMKDSDGNPLPKL